MTDEDLIKKDMMNETIDDTINELKLHIKLLDQQNANIHHKLDEENTQGFEMTKLLRARKPFNRTATGEIIFPGKKEMESKLDVMVKKIGKLKAVLHGFQKDRSQVNLTKNIFKSINSVKSDEDNGDNDKSKLNEELNEQYDKMKNEFNEHVLEISKYRVKLDEVNRELDVNKKRLTENQADFDEASKRLANAGPIDINNIDEIDYETKLKTAKDCLDDLKSVAAYQMEELNDINKSYVDVLREKEYQRARANKLCKEKTLLTAEYDTEFKMIKTRFKKQIEHVENMPTILKTLHEQMDVQKEQKTSVEKDIETLSRYLKTIKPEEICNG